VLGIPLIAAIQAGWIVMQYRTGHGEAPHPVVPSHGSVTVRLRNVKDDASTGTRSTTGRSGSTTTAIADGNSDSIDSDKAVGLPANTTDSLLVPPESSAVPSSVSPSNSSPPLRLLVIGDSLAAGVGTTTSCTPILPRAIATSLSRELGGRPVQWTALGEPGASAGWITRTLESFRDDDDEGEENDIESSGSGDGGYTSTGGKDVDGTLNFEGWLRQQLYPHDDADGTTTTTNGSLDAAIDSEIGKYDVAVVLTGSNDLKFTVLPFMFRQQRKAESTPRGKGKFASELRNAIEAVSRKMKVRGTSIVESIDRVLVSVEESFDAVRNSVEQALPEAVIDRIIWSNLTMDVRGGGGGGVGLYLKELREAVHNATTETMILDDDDNVEGASDVSNADDDEQKRRQTVTPSARSRHTNKHRPLVILPALPAKVLPAAQLVPLRWIALPLLRVIERAKRRLAALYPHSVVFVDAPKKSDFDDYRQQRGMVWQKKQAEDEVMTVTDVNSFECQLVLQQMREYYDAVGTSSTTGSSKNTRMTQASPFLAPDGVHPNDLGYEYWGRSIAESIVKEWSAGARSESSAMLLGSSTAGSEGKVVVVEA